jgi:hypothetical protein
MVDGEPTAGWAAYLRNNTGEIIYTLNELRIIIEQWR